MPSGNRLTPTWTVLQGAAIIVIKDSRPSTCCSRKVAVARSITSSLSNLRASAVIIVALSCSNFFSRVSAYRRSRALSLSKRAMSALNLLTMSSTSSCVRSCIVPSGVLSRSFPTGVHSNLSPDPLFRATILDVLSSPGPC
ncbi:hypothetical protein ACLB2K_037760 [Fragaria x ananassa]